MVTVKINFVKKDVIWVVFLIAVFTVGFVVAVGVDPSVHGHDNVAKVVVDSVTSIWGGWREAIEFTNPAHAAITFPAGNLLFGMHSNRRFYFADTAADGNGYIMSIDANVSKVRIYGDLQVDGVMTGGGTGTGDITGVTAGSGLSGGGATGEVTLNADTGYLQRRVSSTCAAGSSIRAISATGTVTCETDNVGSGAVSGNVMKGERTFDGGHEHMCAVIDDGTIRCWGRNDWGQLGDGASTRRYTPYKVSGISNAIQVSTGELMSCALLSTGSVKCWGHNGQGQLGDGTTTSRKTPVTVSGISDAVQIEVSDYRTACVVRSGGTVKCWGYNGHGEVGDGTTTNRKSPVTVSGLSNVDTVDCGGYHCCAMLNSGTVKCWGYNAYGQVGDGTTTQRKTPVTVSGITDAVDIAMGSYHSCAVRSGGTVKCWGYNNYGQVGDGTTTTRKSPVTVSGLTNVVKIDADRGNSLSHGHSCVIRTNGLARCWGYNGYAHLADGTEYRRYKPINVYGMEDIYEVNLGFGSTCFLNEDSALFCVGNNNYGQIGIGDTTRRRALQKILI